MFPLDTYMPSRFLQQNQPVWAFAHFSAENIGLLPSTERD